MENSIFNLLIMFYIHLNAAQYDDTALEKMVVAFRNEVHFWRLFIFYLLVRSEGRLVGRSYVFLCMVWTILFNIYFGKFLMTFIDIGEIDRMGMHT